jgi:hypothetical protein
VDDVACTFEKYKINIEELQEYLKWVDTPEFALKKHDLIFKTLLNEESTSSSNLLCQNTKKQDDQILPSLMNIKQKKKKNTKTNREFLGYCDDPENKELLERLSDEEFEHVYDYMPLMTREQPAKSGK